MAAGINYGITLTTDANGKAKTTFQVTMQPGDNFRVAAAMSNAELDLLTTYEEGIPPNPDFRAVLLDNAQLSGTDIGLTDMLTVWRRLWIERDAMVPPAVIAPVSATVESIHIDIPYNANVNAKPIRVDIALNSTQANDVLKSDFDTCSTFEGGIIVLGGTPYTILDNSAMHTDPDGVARTTIYLAESAIGSGAVPALIGTPTTVMDDDVTMSLGTPANPRFFSGGRLLQSAFRESYILPMYADEFNTRKTRGFKLRVPNEYLVTDAVTGIGGTADLTSENDFWATFVISAFQEEFDEDADADATALAPYLNLPVEAPTTGLTYGSFNTVYIYYESLRETNFTTEYLTGVHEIGHTSGGLHGDGGIMSEGAPKNLPGGVPNTSFANLTQTRLRDLVK